MGKFDRYIVPLRGLKSDTHRFEYKLTSSFFAKIGDLEITKGKLNAILDIKKINESFELTFNIKGSVQISCDRCLDDMEQLIETQDKIFVKFGKEFTEESDNIVVIPFDEGEINVAWFMFEFIALNIPIKHVHQAGECNKEMASKLKQISAYEKNDELDEDFDFEDEAENTKPTDPRWDGLKKIIQT